MMALSFVYLLRVALLHTKPSALALHVGSRACLDGAFVLTTSDYKAAQVIIDTVQLSSQAEGEINLNLVTTGD